MTHFHPAFRFPAYLEHTPEKRGATPKVSLRCVSRRRRRSPIRGQARIIWWLLFSYWARPSTQPERRSGRFNSADAQLNQCPGLESNQHDPKVTSPSSWRVCHFRHPGSQRRPAPSSQPQHYQPPTLHCQSSIRPSRKTTTHPRHTVATILIEHPPHPSPPALPNLNTHCSFLPGPTRADPFTVQIGSTTTISSGNIS